MSSLGMQSGRSQLAGRGSSSSKGQPCSKVVKTAWETQPISIHMIKKYLLFPRGVAVALCGVLGELHCRIV